MPLTPTTAGRSRRDRSPVAAAGMRHTGERCDRGSCRAPTENGISKRALRENDTARVGGHLGLQKSDAWHCSLCQRLGPSHASCCEDFQWSPGPFIAIISILAALLLPALAGGKERARRVACKNQLRQFTLAVQLFADDHGEKLPSGASENFDPEDEHMPVISTATRESLIRYGGSERILHCPSLGRPFTDPDGWYFEDYGYVIGYNYLGGHTNIPWPVFDGFEPWISPQSTTDRSSLVLLTDANNWSPGYGKTFAPHGNRGPILRDADYSNEGVGGASSHSIGAAGGNVALLDGSVSWKRIELMKHCRGSQLWDESGCFSAW